jgi:dimethylaniline monooxygenase (N-oxide forming)
MYVPTLAHPTFAVLGLIQPLGSIMPIAEMQSRVYFDVLTGGSRLPSKSEMIDDMQNKKMEMDARYVDSRRHTIQVDYIPYMDELADLIGVRPNILSTALHDPQLAWRLLVGPNVAYVYRLQGPHRWSGARDAIMNVWQRIDGATQTRITAPSDDNKRIDIVNKSYGQVITIKIYFMIAIFVTYLFWALF